MPAVSALLSGLILLVVIRFLPDGILGTVIRGVKALVARRTVRERNAD